MLLGVYALDTYLEEEGHCVASLAPPRYPQGTVVDTLEEGTLEEDTWRIPWRRVHEDTQRITGERHAKTQFYI